MIDTHYDESTSPPTPSLCHGHCALGRIALTDALESVRGFLRCNPRQVVTLIVEANISGPDTREASRVSGPEMLASTISVTTCRGLHRRKPLTDSSASVSAMRPRAQ